MGIFLGLQRVGLEGGLRDFMEIVYRDGDKLLVPVEDLNLIQKYSRTGADIPILDKLGTGNWDKTKAKVRKAVEAVAAELVELYARRRAQKGFTFATGEWEEEFDKTFDFQETEDQLRSIKETREDMESDAPMDRLVCGDVGYGKTEVAMRAAFKAVMDGKQVAVLCPTTVPGPPAPQDVPGPDGPFPGPDRGPDPAPNWAGVGGHHQGCGPGVCRHPHRDPSHALQGRDIQGPGSPGDRRGAALRRRPEGEDQAAPEQHRRADPDRDANPQDAQPFHGRLAGHQPDRDAAEGQAGRAHRWSRPSTPSSSGRAIKQELGRGGQVFYIHNRIEDIDAVTTFINKLVPEARVISAHGRTPAAVLEKRMMAFINREYDVLVSTTIIENGIDIPMVNTLIVDRADTYGLAQLYQLRGRVGRSSRQAFAYFLVPAYTGLSPLAKERLKALKEFSELGSGFRLAAKDLEIRGAGTLLGHRQHGSIEAVGFDYYMQLLDQAVKKFKGERVETYNPEIRLKSDIRIPDGYIPQVNVRLNMYKRIASVEDLAEIDRLREEIGDRFGPPPDPVENLLLYGAVKHLARQLGIASVDKIEARVLLKFTAGAPVEWPRIPAFLKEFRAGLSPEGVMTLNLGKLSERSSLEETIRSLKALKGYITMTREKRSADAS